MNYFNRETNNWYDEKIPKFLKQFSKGKFVSKLDYFIETHYENVSMNSNGFLSADIIDITLINIIFNVNYQGNIYDDFVSIFSYNKNGKEFYFSFD